MAASVHDADAIEMDPDMTRGHVRSMPDPWKMLGKHFILCDRGPRCRGDACTFAHSTDELDTWNTQLEEWRQLQRDGAKLHTPKYEEPTEELVLWRHQEQQSDLVMSAPHLCLTKSEMRFEPKKLASPINVEEAKMVLSQQSYQPKFHSLLDWEEKHHMDLLSQR